MGGIDPGPFFTALGRHDDPMRRLLLSGHCGSCKSSRVIIEKDAEQETPMPAVGAWHTARCQDCRLTVSIVLSEPD